MPVFYEGIRLDIGYRLDILVEQKVVVELKTVDILTDVHRAQLLSYLRLGGYRLGYLLNFNVRTLKTGICRLANAL
jgi:GxxExxY protein